MSIVKENETRHSADVFDLDQIHVLHIMHDEDLERVRQLIVAQKIPAINDDACEQLLPDSLRPDELALQRWLASLLDEEKPAQQFNASFEALKLHYSDLERGFLAGMVYALQKRK